MHYKFISSIPDSRAFLCSKKRLKKMRLLWLGMSLVLVSLALAATLEEDVVGGRNTDIRQSMQAAYVIGTLQTDFWGGPYPSHTCGATMIQRYSPMLLLTAAHCVKPIKGPGGGWTDPRNQNEYWAFRGWNGPGSHNQWTFPSFRAYRIMEVYFPNAWRKSNQPIFGDIAVVRLRSGEDRRAYFNVPIATHHFVSQLGNHPINPDRHKHTFKEEITGWGKASAKGDYVRHVQTGSVWDIPLAWCRKMIAGFEEWMAQGKHVSDHDRIIDGIIRKYQGKSDDRDLVYDLTHRIYDEMFNETYKPSRHWVFDDEVCAMDIKNGQTSNCYGDSGGPLYYRFLGSSSKTLMGVVSSSIVGTCSPKVPVMYSSLDYYSDWIKSLHACIMLDRVKVWDALIKRGDLKKRLFVQWTKIAISWRNKGRTGSSPGMFKRALRNRRTEYGFRKFYVDYIRPYQSVMNEWCDMKPKIEAMYEEMNERGWGTINGKDHSSFHLDMPGFFPSLVEFSEWVGQGRQEKYRRAWADPFYIADTLKIPQQWRKQVVNLKDNIAVSMDIHFSENARISLRLFDIGNGLIHARIYRNTLFFAVRNRLICKGVKIPFEKTQNKATHIEFVLMYRRFEIKAYFNGSLIKTCLTRRLRWHRGLSLPIGMKPVLIGKPRNGYRGSHGYAYLRNVEVRTWVDPPMCCTEFNNFDGKCIRNCFLFTKRG